MMKKKRKKKKTSKYRSGFEERIAANLKRAGNPFSYELERLEYESNKICTYTPDFLLPNGIFVEAKGRFTPQDRTKMLLVKRHHPDKDIRFLFQRPNNKLNKNSKTTYAQWAEKHGFKWFGGEHIPKEWIDEQPE